MRLGLCYTSKTNCLRTTMDHSEMLSALKSHNQLAYNKLYIDYYPTVLKFIINNSGSEADAEDTFQEALMVLIGKLEYDNFKLTASLQTYLVAISKNIWFKKLRNRHFEIEVTDLSRADFLDELDQAIENEKSYLERLKLYLNKISKHCNKLINDMFFGGKTIEEVQADYGYSSRHNAINQKHKCINQIRRVKEEDVQPA